MGSKKKLISTKDHMLVNGMEIPYTLERKRSFSRKGHALWVMSGMFQTPEFLTAIASRIARLGCESIISARPDDSGKITIEVALGSPVDNRHGIVGLIRLRTGSFHATRRQAIPNRLYA